VLRLFGCIRARRRMVEYVDGFLSPREAEVVRAHLRECARCRRLAQDMLEVRKALSVLPSVRAKPGFREGVWEGVEAKAGARRRTSSRRVWRLLAPIPAVAAILVFALLMIFRAPISQGSVPAAPSFEASEVHLAYESAYPLSNIYALGEYVSRGSEED